MRDNETPSTAPDRTGIESMFDSIARRYDFLNHFLSFGIDRIWRRKAVRIIGRHARNPEIIDVATGTGDLAIEALSLDPVNIKGIDISARMLDEGKKKIRKKGYEGIIELIRCESENILFRDNRFDVAMTGFGVRNFSDPLRGLSEMCRVLKPGGLVMVLEFSNPQKFPFRNIFRFYFRRILPLTGSFFSGNRAAYSYLPDSVGRFPDNERFLRLLSEAGFTGVKQKRLTGGIVSVYTGFKPLMQ